MTKRKDPADLLPMGRKSTFTQEMADKICKKLSQGESLRTIMKADGMPDISTVYDWLNKFPAFADQYARAREEQAETMADEIVSIADETPQTVMVLDKNGDALDIKLDSAYIQWQRQRIDARKWTASKLRPKKYGDRVVHAGDEENPMVVEQSLGVFGDLLKALKLQRQADK
jgi:transcriptional regulator with PAS, ATPase and Fis domain